MKNHFEYKETPYKENHSDPIDSFKYLLLIIAILNLIVVAQFVYCAITGDCKCEDSRSRIDNNAIHSQGFRTVKPL